jgi:hypothetical protein
MIPLFVSDYSIGKSILKIPKIIELAKTVDLLEAYLVEDSMIGFLDSFKKFKDAGINLRFGVRLNMCNDVTDEDRASSSYKIILFALDDDGVKLLYKVFFEHEKNGGFLDLNYLSGQDLKSILVMHPFYDSYIYNNLMYFKNCIYSLSPELEYYSREDNGLPFDKMVANKLPKDKVVDTKTIFYEGRGDVEAYQVYRMACSRAFGFKQCLSRPNIEHFGSREFCFQSYLEEING